MERFERQMVSTLWFDGNCDLHLHSQTLVKAEQKTVGVIAVESNET